MGRWISRDPKKESGGDNLYVFIENNVVNHLDYLGQTSIDLQALIKKELIPRGTGAWDGSWLVAKPFIAPIGAFLQIHFYGTVMAKPCCDMKEGDVDLMWEVRGGLEAFLQWGTTMVWDTPNHGKLQPNKGYRERSLHADFNNKKAICPDTTFEVADWSVVAFIRGSAGVGIFGFQASLEYPIYQRFNPDSLIERFNGSASLSMGIIGGSVELGLGGSIGLRGKVELPVKIP